VPSLLFYSGGACVAFSFFGVGVFVCTYVFRAILHMGVERIISSSSAISLRPRPVSGCCFVLDRDNKKLICS
jgi:hypothetical protein